MKAVALILAGAVVASCSAEAEPVAIAAAATTKKCAAPHVFADFDDTIVQGSTLSTLAKAIYKATPSDKVTLPPLSKVLAEYNKNLTASRKQYGSFKTVNDEVKYQSSAARRKVDANLYRRLADSGMGQYLTADDLDKAAQTVKFKPEWWEFAFLSVKNGQVPTVISDNFSLQWVRRVLFLGWQDYCNDHKSDEYCQDDDFANNIPIYANEFLTKRLVAADSKDHVTSIHNGADKVALIKKLAPSGTVFYAGNKLKDIPPIIAADIGAFMSDRTQSTLEKEGANLESYNLKPKNRCTPADADTIYVEGDFKRFANAKTGLFNSMHTA